MYQAKKVITQAIWSKNTALVQLLGLCPLLAITSSIVDALGLGLSITLILILTNLFVSLLRYWIPNEIRIPIYIIIISSVVSIVQMLLNAYMLNLYKRLGLFIPLITTNCIIISRAEIFAIRNTFIISALDGFATGIGVTYVMCILGLIREVLSNGTLFNNADILFGAWAKSIRIEIFHVDTTFLFTILPPGAFISLGMILALKYIIDKSHQHNNIVTIKQ